MITFLSHLGLQVVLIYALALRICFSGPCVVHVLAVVFLALVLFMCWFFLSVDSGMDSLWVPDSCFACGQDLPQWLSDLCLAVQVACICSAFKHTDRKIIIRHGFAMNHLALLERLPGTGSCANTNTGPLLPIMADSLFAPGLVVVPTQIQDLFCPLWLILYLHLAGRCYASGTRAGLVEATILGPATEGDIFSVCLK